jgi:peptidoglycan/LPS O-acetylase OafA/YrhL
MLEATAQEGLELGQVRPDPPRAIHKPEIGFRRAKYIPALDGVRGAAILLVLIHHFLPPGDDHLVWHGLKLSHLLGNMLGRVSRSGWCGVDLFFVLSGFLITGILADARNSTRYFRNFYIRRALRVLPLYYSVVIVCIVVLPLFFNPPDARTAYIIHHALPLWTHTTNLAMAYRGELYFGGGMLQVSHFWSLAIEEQFYLFWPIVLLLPRRKVMGICAALFLLSGGLRLGLTLRGAPWETVYTFTLCRLDGLVAGAWLALWMRGPAGMKRLVMPAWITLGGCTLGLLMLAKAAGDWSLEREGKVTQTVIYTVLALFFAAGLALVLAGNETGGLKRFFANPVLRFFGRYSYGLYVFNSLLAPLFDAHFSAHQIGVALHSFALGALLNTALALGLTVLAAVLSYHFFEKRFLALKDVLAPDRPRGTSAAPIAAPA